VVDTVDLMAVAAALNQAHPTRAEAAAAFPNLAEAAAATADLMVVAAAPNQEVHLLAEAAALNLEVVPDPMEEAVAEALTEVEVAAEEVPNQEVPLLAEAAALNLEVVPDSMEEAVAEALTEAEVVAEDLKVEVAEAEDLTQSMISPSQWLDQLVLNQLKQHKQVQVHPLQMKFQSGRLLSLLLVVSFSLH